ncbi:hypothetical protein D3C80_1566200 [compost metagenome]
MRAKRIARLQNSTGMNKWLLFNPGISAMQDDAVLTQLVAGKTGGSPVLKRACLSERACLRQALVALPFAL